MSLNLEFSEVVRERERAASDENENENGDKKEEEVGFDLMLFIDLMLNEPEELSFNLIIELNWQLLSAEPHNHHHHT